VTRSDSPFRATYRLQLGRDLGFREAGGLVPYLQELGVSHLYLSPSLRARTGSTHGYDVVDPTRISEELGGEAAFRELARAGLGIVLDVVPNHMAASDENPYWVDPALRPIFFDLDSRTGFQRRFFDIGELAGVRVEDPAVFETTHRFVLELVREGLVAGLRIDHPDGLADPAGYLERLHRESVEHVWVEKILEPGEELRPWPVEGTTGYEFVNETAGLFVDPAGEVPLTELYADLTGERRSFAEIAHEAKLEQAAGTFEPELRELHQELDVPNLAQALASFRVYRTYVEPWSGRVADADREAIAGAALSDRLERILLLEEPGHDAFVTRFQQTTGAVMAKGVEDTAFYRYNRLLALNEVGGDPGRFGLSVEAFHAANLKRAQRFPRGLLATQTHDTKRSADVRARIAALAGIPTEWERFARRWLAGAPDRNEGYLILQTLVGAWPLSLDRLERYVEKALREEKRHTSWVDPDRRWEESVRAWCRGLLEDTAFTQELEALLQGIRIAAELASLGQVLLKLTSPGLPDIYQGDELEALSLVDPDNRRPVDWQLRRDLLTGVRRGASPTRETMKLHLLARALELRRRRPDAFLDSYVPLEAGPDVCAYRRGAHVAVVVPIRPRAPKDLLDLGSSWVDLLPEYPVALLERQPGPEASAYLPA
jgi:(1->4)-alpha-D-glucan 1-alpha-D-glucosylmutase